MRLRHGGLERESVPNATVSYNPISAYPT
jgi:hypothetical protein